MLYEVITDRLRVEQGDRHRLAQVMVGLDVEQRRGARLCEQHAQAEPGQVGGAAPLDGGKGRRVCGEQRGDPGHP